MTLVLRLRELDLCRLSSTGCPIRCDLISWSSRDSVSIGILSLCVKVPSEWETLEILRRWLLEQPCPLSFRTSRRQLIITKLRLRLVPRWCVWSCTLTVATFVALLTQTPVWSTAL